MTLNQTKAIRLSEHFTLYEFVHSETEEKMGVDNMPDETQLRNLTLLCEEILEPARLKLGEPIKVSSGLRCRRLNQAVGGVYNSQHITGCAADIRIRSWRYRKRIFAILASNPHVDQLLMEHTKKKDVYWVHVSRSDNPRHLIDENYEAI